MRRTCLAILFCLFAITAFGQDKDVSNDQPPIKFHYALVGSAAGIRVSVNLDDFVIPWISDYVAKFNASAKRDKQKASQIATEMRNRLSTERQLYSYAVHVTNASDRSLGLNAFTDVLTLRDEWKKTEYRPDSASAYPSNLVGHSQMMIRFPMVERADKFDAMNNAVFWTNENGQLSKLASLMPKGRAKVLTALRTMSQQCSKTFFGDLSFGTAGVTVPLAVEITLVDN